MNKSAALAPSNQLFKAFADPTRLRILSLMFDGERCVCHLIDALNLPQSTISRHLAYLKRAGLVESREQGTWNYYRLSKPAGKLHESLVACLAQCLDEVPQLKQDKRRLSKECKNL